MCNSTSLKGDIVVGATAFANTLAEYVLLHFSYHILFILGIYRGKTLLYTNEGKFYSFSVQVKQNLINNKDSLQPFKEVTLPPTHSTTKPLAP